MCASAGRLPTTPATGGNTAPWTRMPRCRLVRESQDDQPHDEARLPVRVGQPARPEGDDASLLQHNAALDRRLPPPLTGHSIITIPIGSGDLCSSIVSPGDPTRQLLDNATSKVRADKSYLATPSARAL